MITGARATLQDGTRSAKVAHNGGARRSSEDLLLRLARDLSGHACLSPEAQKEGAKLFALLPDIKGHPDGPFLRIAMENAIRALMAEPENVSLASHSRRMIEKRIKVYRNPMRAMTREAPTTWLLFGLFTLMFIAWLPILVGAGLNLESQLLGFALSDVILVFVFGAFGSVVSLLRRVENINEKRTSPVILFWTGFTKPMVGALFALFFYAAVQSKIIAIDLTQYEPGPFFAAAAFLAGFSERFVPDLAKRVEGTLAVREQPAAGPGGTRERGVKVDVPEDQIRKAKREQAADADELAQREDRDEVGSERPS